MQTSHITTKKMQLIPVGEKEERDRVYQYRRDGIYNQHKILNTYMSQTGIIYYKYNKDYKDPGFKEEYKMIFRNTNTAIHDFEQAKGLGMAGNCAMRVKQDFSTALKNGLAKGERALPFYKRDFPLIVPSRFMTFYTGEDRYIDDEGVEQTVSAYFIKFVNGIHFKVILGSGRNKKPDKYLPSLLRSIVEDPDNYHVCGSTIQFTKKGGKIILNLSVKINKEAEAYKPVPGRIMGLAMGYDKCLVAAMSDDEEMYTIADSMKENIIEKRKRIQEDNRRMQISLKEAKGGHGRGRKLAKIEQHKNYEKNVMRNFNHELSKKVVALAKEHKAEAILVEDISGAELENYPVLLRNWSYYQLQSYISYKAKQEGIDVVIGKGKRTEEEIRGACCFCGCILDDENIIPKEIEWCHELSFTCPDCKKTIDYSYNKAKNMIAE